MKQFPEEYELLSFFESEPEILDRDVPWFYNRLMFKNTFGDATIRCEIEPAYGQIDLFVHIQNISVATLHLEWIQSLQIKSDKNVETMIAKFKDETGILDFELQLKPHVLIRWGNKEVL
jgi:hypothetical protein